ncbi:MAG: hypothetical protein EBZ77_04535, partial [Chitinophagia bacterium]|nr:hypothetical protein [Chitinophagia bacterium]
KHAKAMLAAREVIEQYARENRKLFSDKKTVEMHGITFGFKMGSPKVLLGTVVEETTEAVKAAWEKALQQLKKYLPDYVKTQEEIAKAKLLTDKKVIDPKVLAKCGLKIDSDETFILQRNP